MLPDIFFPMQTQEKYAPEIWGKICRLPFMVAIGMEGAGKSGLAGSASERKATMQTILEASTEYPGNPLVGSILPAQENEQALALVMQKHDAALDFLASSGIRTSEGLWERILDCIREVIPVLETREAGHTISDYMAWLTQIAEQVALAAKEGDFMGIGGSRFSDQEMEQFRRLQAVLKEFDRTS